MYYVPVTLGFDVGSSDWVARKVRGFLSGRGGGGGRVQGLAKWMSFLKGFRVRQKMRSLLRVPFICALGCRE